MDRAKFDTDILIIGGGFFGSCLALFLRSVSNNITIIEAEPELLTRASKVNQARVHSGFHYPRSMLTAAKSMLLHKRFALEFSDAIVSNFRMLYAVSKRNSKVSAQRFWRMFQDLEADIRPASANQSALFDPKMIEAAFECTEFAFDHSVLRRMLHQRLVRCGIDLKFNTKVESLLEESSGVQVGLSNGSEIRARTVFNVTYSNVNNLLRGAGIPIAKLKHELTEVALVTPPEELNNLAITVMDGPFFSIMPFPSEDLYSLTHVRYTPRVSWKCDASIPSQSDLATMFHDNSKAHHMIVDAQRYMPCLAKTIVERSLYEVKTVLTKNEQDDGRPILFHRHPNNSRIISVLGGKIDNIYDLFEIVKSSDPSWAHANLHYLTTDALE